MIGGCNFMPGKRDKTRRIPMRDVAKLTPDQLKRRQSFLEHGFEMFSSRSIEAVYLPDVAKASGHGIATLYRYFSTKAEFALAIAEWKWGEFFQENRKRRPNDNFEDKTAADMLDFYLESFLELYRKHKALLRFNQLFNIYIRAENIDTGTVDAYRGLMQPIVEYFHVIYEKAKQDGTVRTDVSETEMLSTTIHLMLAAVTRYAVGLVYQPEDGFDAEQELEAQKRMLYREFTTR